MGKGSKRRPEDVKAIDKNWNRAMNPEMWCPICGTDREPFHEICKACEDTFGSLIDINKVNSLVVKWNELKTE